MSASAFDESISDEAAVPPTPARYDRVSISFHWLTLVLLVAMFWSAWARAGVEDASRAAWLLTLHRSAGMLVWTLTLLRIVWRILFAAVPPLPPAVSTPQYVAARANQLGLYLLLILQPITGFLQTIWRGKPFALFGATIPAIAPRDKDLSHLFHQVHETGATVLLVLIGMHALAALFHGLVRRDGVLDAMLPIRASRRARPEPAVGFDTAMD